MRKLVSILILLLLVSFSTSVNAQEEKEKKDKAVHEFEMVYDVYATNVKSQDKTGTCWCFATKSFLESELYRMGKGDVDLSEMFIVRNTYPLKAERYFRYHGMFNFGQGGQAHDVMHIIKKYGLMPESAYSGKAAFKDEYNHSEMERALKGMLDGVISGRGEKSRVWLDAVNAVLDVYLGDIPQKFEYEGETYTPESFRDEMGINPDDYVEFTSYISYPMWEAVNLELPDNWTFDLYYNVPADDLMRIMDYALENGYSVAWDGDVSEKTFNMKTGYAVLPEDGEYSEEEPETEIEVTDESRQKTFDTFSTTDDHLMHMTGLAKNQEGTDFYYIKNSWGESGKYDGYIYMSEPYVKMKTIAFMVHKDAVPSDIKDKLGIE